MRGRGSLGVIPELVPEEPAGGGAWTEGGIHPVAPGVHRIPLPLPNDGLRAVNVYAIEDAARIVLIDAGWEHDECWAALERGLAAIGAAAGDVERVLITHVHRDHYGQATRLRGASGASVLLGEGERLSMETALDERRARSAREAHRLQMHRWGATALVGEIVAAFGETGFGGIPGEMGKWAAPDVYAADDMVITLRSRSLEVVPTPGHTRGHVVFADRGHRLLFAGDHILPHITPSIGFEPFTDGQGLISFLASLTRVRSLPVDRVLPAHGPVFAGLTERVDALVEHHATRLDACVAEVRSGRGTVFEVAQGLRWTRRERHFEELNLFNRLLAVIETAAHLEVLVARGTLAVVERDQVRLHAVAQEIHSAAVVETVSLPRGEQR
jgi:glyoxylase-like metal-dependent hydrolase (beta-lactamase superfamily II)